MEKETPGKETKELSEETKWGKKLRRIKRSAVVNTARKPNKMTEKCSWKLTIRGSLVVLERRVMSDWRGRTPTCKELKRKMKTGSQVKRICTLGDGKDPHEPKRGILWKYWKKERDSFMEQCYWEVQGGIQNTGKWAHFRCEDAEKQEKCSVSQRLMLWNRQAEW